MRTLSAIIIIFLLCISRNGVSQEIFSNQRSIQDTISMVNGRYYTGNKKLSLSAMSDLMTSSQISYNLYTSGVQKKTLGKVLGFGGGFLIGWPIGQLVAGTRNDPKWAFAFGGLFLSSVGYMINTSGTKLIERAIHFHNNSVTTSLIEQSKNGKIGVNINGDGLSLVLTF